MTVEPSCVQCRDNLIEFTAGLLPQASADAIRRHLTTCAACGSELAAWHALAMVMDERDRRAAPDVGASAGWLRLEAALAAESGDRRQEEWREDTMIVEEPTQHFPVTTSPVSADRRHSSRLRSHLLSAVAAVLVVSFAAALFGLQMYRNGAHPSQVTPHATCAPNQIRAELPKGTELYAVSMMSPDEGWAVGATNPSGGPVTSLILHYSQCRWTPESFQLPGVTFDMVSAVSASDVWAFGIELATATGTHRLTGVIVHFTGAQWQESALPITVSDDQIVTGFSMVNPDEGWLHVAQRNSRYGWGPPYQLYHGLHGKWSLVSAPGYQNLWLVKAIAPGEAWLTANRDSAATQQVLMLYRNGVLTPTYTFPTHTSVEMSHQIQMDGSQDAWVTVRMLTAQGAPSGWQLLHCTFSACSQSPLLDDAHIQPSDFVQVYSPNEGWAFLMNQPAPSYPTAPHYTIFRLRNGQWQRMPVSYQFYSVLDIQRVTSDEYWICTPAALLHFANGSWSLYS